MLREKTQVESKLAQFQQPKSMLEEAELLIELGEEEDDDSSGDELDQLLANVSQQIEALELQRMLGGESDRSNAFVQINPGAGGTESQDWAEILMRMYLRWCEEKGYKTEMVDFLPGEVAGIKSATIRVEGDYAYGYLKAEIGIHRLVRISPFDSAKRRHTSFASVFVSPEVDDDIEIEVDETELRIDTYRSSGAGGQHVNKTDSAVRITHLPTNIVVQCQNERSQHKNKAMAMKMLRSRLYERELEERRKAQDAVNATKKDIDFGSQIRSYVLHPYRMVKDHRTSFEMGNADAVLDGALDGFIRAYLLAEGDRPAQS